MFASLMRKLGWDEASRQRQKQLDSAIEALLALADARLCLLPNHVAALRAGMRTSQAYLASFPEHLPPVLPLSWQAYRQDARLGLFFSSPASVLSVIKASDAVRQFFLSASNGDELWALLEMQCSEQRRFGVVMEQGEVRSDVAQTIVSFDAHRIHLSCTSLSVLQQQSILYAQQYQYSLIAQHLADLEATRQTCDSELTSLRLKQFTLQSSLHTVGSTLEENADTPVTLQTVTARIAQLEQQQAALRQQLSLESLLKTVQAMLEHPARYLRMEAQTLYLSRMGVKCEGAGQGEEFFPLQLEELIVGASDPVRRAVLPVYLHRSDWAELEQQFGDIAL